MQTFLYSTLLFHGLATVAIMVGMALNALLPERRAHFRWELPDAGNGVRARHS